MTSQKTSKKKHVHRALIIGSLLILASLLAYISSIYFKVKQYDTVLSSNLSINNVSVGGMTPDEAFEKLSHTLLPALGQKKILATAEGITSPITFTYEALGVKYNLDEVMKEAKLIGHEGDFFERYKAFKKPPSSPIQLTLKPSFDEAKVKDYIASLLKTFYKAPVDAKMERRNRAFNITPGAYGYTADIQSALTQVIALISKDEEGTIKVPLLPVAPTYTSEKLEILQTPLASFYTDYNNADLKRNTNLELASRNINTVLMPNEKFMFSKQLEPITAEAGYKSSKVIVDGNFEEGIGGGICQVSSTLYNALLLTDIDIYMRRNHSLPVSYTPLGRDATYATDSVDFQFINNTGYPLYVESYCENNKIYVNLYGHPSFKPTYDAKFESVTVETIAPPPTRYEEDPTLAPGTEVQKSSSKVGHKVVLYKLFYENGQLVKKEQINTSVYKSRPEVILRGPALDKTPASPSANS